MSKFKKLQASLEEPAPLDADAKESVLATATQRHEIPSPVGWVGALVSLTLASALFAGVAASGYAAVESVWKVIHLPEGVKLPTVNLPRLPQVGIPDVRLPSWLRDIVKLPSGGSPDSSPQPASSNEGPSAQSTASASPRTTAERELAFLSAVRAAVSTPLNDAALLDLGRAACTALSKSRDVALATQAVSRAAAAIAAQVGISASQAAKATGATVEQTQKSGLCGG